MNLTTTFTETASKRGLSFTNKTVIAIITVIADKTQFKEIDRAVTAKYGNNTRKSFTFDQRTGLMALVKAASDEPFDLKDCLTDFGVYCDQCLIFKLPPPGNALMSSFAVKLITQQLMDALKCFFYNCLYESFVNKNKFFGSSMSDDDVKSSREILSQINLR